MASPLDKYIVYSTHWEPPRSVSSVLYYCTCRLEYHQGVLLAIILTPRRDLRYRNLLCSQTLCNIVMNLLIQNINWACMREKGNMAAQGLWGLSCLPHPGPPHTTVMFCMAGVAWHALRVFYQYLLVYEAAHLGFSNSLAWLIITCQYNSDILIQHLQLENVSA